MTEDKTSNETKKPKINIVDRRHWVSEDEASNDEETSAEIAEEKLPTYVERLKKDAEDKDKRLREYIAAYKNKNIENDEFRVRLQKENETRLDQFKAILFARLLPILDNLKRATESASQSKDLGSLQQGIDLVVNQFTRELKDNGVEAVSSVGEKFDPKAHEAILTEETEDTAQDGMVVEEFEPGYQFKGKLIKPAKVKISKLKK